MTSKDIAGNMPLNQEKRSNTISNNNDHNYLHKKFKKMASTAPVLTSNQPRGDDVRQKEPNVTQNTSSTPIPNGSISAAHPEIEKIKEIEHRQYVHAASGNNVQINYSNENSRLGNVNTVQVSGQTSLTDEFLNKTDNLENDFIRETYNGTVGGRYICPYCKLSCAKPSVLQKHIRAHTNERPYPCIPCGFAFKTKSNLYKHRRSRMHALRLQGTDVPASLNDDDVSGGSESDTPTSISETGSDVSNFRPELLDFKPTSPEAQIDLAQQRGTNVSPNESSALKSIYKPKFRAGVAFYRESDDKDKIKKPISPNADFLNEHISKIISDNEAIIDVIETPLQKKYGKIKQIAESKQFMTDMQEIKSEVSPLNLTKSNELDSSFRKRSHSESFSQGDFQKHPLNPEGSIIKDLLLKTKMNGMVPITGELLDGPLYLCSVCQIMYRSADNLEIHKLYYCKGNVNSDSKDLKVARSDNFFVRSNSVNVRLPETSSNTIHKSSFSTKPATARLKPENLVISKPDYNDVIAPLPSPGPLLGNTRLVDSRIPSEYGRKNDMKVKMISSPKRKIDNNSDTYSPRLVENVSPRSTDLYPHPKLRCVETTSSSLRSIEELSPNLRNNSTSLQMFGGEVKIVDHSGSTTTLRIEPNKNQLSPIMIQTNLSPSKLISDIEASSVVVRSGLHSGGTIVHNPPTPKESLGTPQPQTTRISLSATTTCVSNLPNIHDITHFQFPPLSAITAFNPLTLPPLSPSASVSPNGATKILHGGKLIPHVPGIPGPNTPSIYVGNTNMITKNLGNIEQKNSLREDTLTHLGNMRMKSPHAVTKYDTQNLRNTRSPNLKMNHMDPDKHLQAQDVLNSDSNYVSSIPAINIKNVEDTNIYSSNSIKQLQRPDLAVKRNIDGVLRTPVLKENTNFSTNKFKNKAPGLLIRTSELKNEKEIRNFNFENLITKTEIFNNQGHSTCDIQKNSNIKVTSCGTPQNERSEPLYFQKNILVKSNNGERKPKFLRPSTLPLKPGTFTPKRHHGITPNANTMPLVSPETPRPAKAYGQLYLNGNAYTYLGLKCSTKVFYCTINRPQPTYVPNQHFLSMYSNWQLLSELTPDPLGLSASSAMSLYDSRHRPQNTSVAVIKHDLILTHSSQWNTFTKENKQTIQQLDVKKLEESKSQTSENLLTPKKELTGGFESNEEYTYVRGRGRGRYVCSECGIRCKKPSMLKKHIRTHTDVRPYTCVHCAFSFKTKGNLTKHMKSKAHYKKCCELGINPNDGDVDTNETAQCSGETDDDTDSDGDEGNEGETESSDTEAYKSRLPEHEAAHCLLSLGGNRPSTSATPGLITSARPTTYPYTPVGLEVVVSYSEKHRTSPTEAQMDEENEPIDLSRNEVKTPNIPEIPTARESSVLASLASNTAKLPQAQNQWVNGEPLLHTYLTERALLDTKIKQSQVTTCLTKHKNIEVEKSAFTDNYSSEESLNTTENFKPIHCIKNDDEIRRVNDFQDSETITPSATTNDITIDSKDSTITLNNVSVDAKKSFAQNSSNPNAENAKHVVSEYLKQAKINLIKAQEDMSTQSDSFGEEKSCDEYFKSDEFSDSEVIKSNSISEHNSVATKVVIGVGGVAFKVTKGKEFESSSFPPSRIMEDGCRDCNFCNKTFTKPSQLRLHLNIHYMERPFRCSICAVSFRTRGHLQKHERSASHHNKISMTSTFGAATSFNPRPFRCSDCNIAFRIHGHLAKHLRSKMHVMRLECLFKLPFGTFTEIERAGVSLTDIDTTDCDSSLASLQLLAKKLHEKDPTKLEYRDPNGVTVAGLSAGRELSEDEDSTPADNMSVSEKNSDIKTSENNDDDEMETRVNCSATDI